VPRNSAPISCNFRLLSYCFASLRIVIWSVLIATTTPLSPRLPITTAGWLATFIFTSPFCFAQAGAPPAQFTLANDAISATWSVRDNRLRWRSFNNGFTNSTLTSDAPVFELLPKEGSIVSYAEPLGDDPGHDFADEVHSYFGTRTQLQEMYVTPALLSEQDWDVLAQSAKWSRTQCRGAEGLALDRRRPRPIASVWLGIMVSGQVNPDAAKSQRSAAGGHGEAGRLVGIARFGCQAIQSAQYVGQRSSHDDLHRSPTHIPFAPI
jgi:hypothetical protein